LIDVNTFFGVYATDSTVCKLVSVSFLQFWALIPNS